MCGPSNISKGKTTRPPAGGSRSVASRGFHPQVNGSHISHKSIAASAHASLFRPAQCMSLDVITEATAERGQVGQVSEPRSTRLDMTRACLMVREGVLQSGTVLDLPAGRQTHLHQPPASFGLLSGK